jgi:hypothetical protein
VVQRVCCFHGQTYTSDPSATALFVLLVWMLPSLLLMFTRHNLGLSGKYGWALFSSVMLRGDGKVVQGASSDDQAHEQGNTIPFVTLPRKATGRVQPSCQKLDKQGAFCDSSDTMEDYLWPFGCCLYTTHISLISCGKFLIASRTVKQK